MACKNRLTQEEIDAAVESATNAYDRRYLCCEMSLEDYDVAMAKLMAWAIEQEEKAP